MVKLILSMGFEVPILHLHRKHVKISSNYSLSSIGSFNSFANLVSNDRLDSLDSFDSLDCP